MGSGNFKIIPPHVLPSPFLLVDSNISSSNVTENDYPAYNPATAYTTVGDRVIVVSPTSAITISAARPCVVTWTGHSLPDKTAIELSTSGSLPTELSSTKVYYTSNATANTFKLSETPGGQEIDTSSTGTGAHSATADRHDVYELLAATTAGQHPALFPAKWVRVGATNRWRMFDSSSSSQTSWVGSIDVTLVANVGRITALQLLNTRTDTAQVIVTDAVDGVVYNKTLMGRETSGIITPSSWFFDPVEFKEEFDFTDLPIFYSDTTIRVILSNPGNQVLCGVCMPGTVYSPGYTQNGYTIGIEDYGIKITDEFGNATLLERGFSKEVDMTVLIDNIQLDKLHRVLQKIRATPVVFVGTSTYGSTALFGYYERYSTLARYSTYSVLSIETRGLV